MTISETPALGLHAWAKSLFDECGSGVWNPLTDDGDALRLAVKLELTINPYTRGVFVSRDEGEPVIRDEWSLDRAKTTRRAIVRAAAEIGSLHNAEITAR